MLRCQLARSQFCSPAFGYSRQNSGYRRDARFCSDACRQWSYRERRLLRMGWGRSNLWRHEEADRWAWFIRKKIEFNPKSPLVRVASPLNKSAENSERVNYYCLADSQTG
jgi:hypothetical protein